MTDIIAGIRMGMLEVECVVRDANGVIQSRELVKKPVRVTIDQTGEQITEIMEV